MRLPSTNYAITFGNPNTGIFWLAPFPLLILKSFGETCHPPPAIMKFLNSSSHKMDAKESITIPCHRGKVYGDAWLFMVGWILQLTHQVARVAAITETILPITSLERGLKWK